MSKEREAELIESIRPHVPLTVFKQFLELVELRRERYRDRLENEESPEHRGRARECKDLLHLFR